MQGFLTLRLSARVPRALAGLLRVGRVSPLPLGAAPGALCCWSYAGLLLGFIGMVLGPFVAQELLPIENDTS